MSNAGHQAGGERQELARISAEVDRALRSFVDRQPVSEFYDLTRYHFGWQAEASPPMRARSVLSVLACQACGGTLEAALPLAVAVALLHEFFVNQRELELDQATSRGRPSVWNVWGKAQAMNAGDGMHALAKVALLEARAGLPAAVILDLEAELDECCLRVCDAIHQELTSGSSSADLAACKSAAPFGLAAYGGCAMAQASPDAAANLRRFGELLGSAVALPAQADTLQAEALKLVAGSPSAALLSALAAEVLQGTSDAPAGSY